MLLFTIFYLLYFYPVNEAWRAAVPEAADEVPFEQSALMTQQDALSPSGCTPNFELLARSDQAAELCLAR